MRQTLQAEGADIELVWVRNGVARVRLVNACGKCPMKSMPSVTVWEWVVSTLKQNVPELIRVE